jgi:C4-dicarboxylate-specific signal transduction histidine kinase
MGDFDVCYEGPLNIPTDISTLLLNNLFDKNRELLELNADLERRIVQRTSDLEHANRLLQEEIHERPKAEKELPSCSASMPSAGWPASSPTT